LNEGENEEINQGGLAILNYQSYERLTRYFQNFGKLGSETLGDEVVHSAGPVLGSDLEGLKSTEYPLLDQQVELVIGSRFPLWIIAEHYIKEYGRQNGFVINRYRVEYQKNSSERIVKKELSLASMLENISLKEHNHWINNVIKAQKKQTVNGTSIYLNRNIVDTCM
jgi:hypothetical protein